MRCLLQRFALHGRRNRRQFRFSERLGAVDEHAGGAVMRVALDAPACRIGRGVGDARERKHRGIADRSVAIGAREIDGSIMHDGVEIVAIREAVLGPMRLDPASANDETGRVRLRILRQGLLQRGDGRRAGEIELHRLQAKLGQVHVAIDEAGKRRCAFEVEHLRIRRAFARPAQRTDERDAIAMKAHRFNRRRAKAGVDWPAMDDDVMGGGRRRWRTRRRERGERTSGKRAA